MLPKIIPPGIKIVVWENPTTRQTCSIPSCNFHAKMELAEFQEHPKRRFKPILPFFACKYHLTIYKSKELELILRFGIILEELEN